MAAVLAIFGIGIVACLAAAGNEVANEIDASMGEAATEDYELSNEKCAPDDVLGVKSTGTIKNTSDTAQGFEIQVRFETSEGKLVSEDSTFTDTIEVGQSQDYEVLSLGEDPPEGGELTCGTPEVSYTIFDDEDEGN